MAKKDGDDEGTLSGDPTKDVGYHKTVEKNKALGENARYQRVQNWVKYYQGGEATADDSTPGASNKSSPTSSRKL